MSEIFPKLLSTLNQSLGVRATSAVHTIEAIKTEVLAKLAAIPQGTVLKGEVIAAMRDGSFIVNLGALPLRLTLPPHTKVGDQLKLNLIQLQPTTTFALENGQTATLVGMAMSQPTTTLANEIQHLKPQTGVPAGHTQGAVTAVESDISESMKSMNQAQLAHVYQHQEQSTDLKLSEFGRLIGSVLRDSERFKQKLAINSASPLTDDFTARLNPSRLAHRLETQLRQQVETSGLSYESHVVQWSNGERSLESLKAEPQGKIALQMEATILTDEHAEHHQQLAEIVHQQLDVIDGFGVNWHGQLSPSIPLQIEFKADESHEPKESPSERQVSQIKEHCSTTMELEFPSLGKMRIEIDFHDNHSDIRCKVSSPEVIQALHQGARNLIDALNGRGQKLQSMKVTSK